MLEGLLDILRTGMFSRVRDKPKAAIDRSAVLAISRCLVNQRTDIKNHIRGIVKTYKIRLGSVGSTKFTQTIKGCFEGRDY